MKNLFLFLLLFFIKTNFAQLPKTFVAEDQPKAPDYSLDKNWCALPFMLDDADIIPKQETWISDEIISAYTDLHNLGMAHSVETYLDNRLVGGLYGVSIGAAFFGESMFHLVSNASKVAFYYLIQLLKHNNYQLLDTQFINDNVKRFGAIEISKAEYLVKLKNALGKKANFMEADFDHLFN